MIMSCRRAYIYAGETVTLRCVAQRQGAAPDLEGYEVVVTVRTTAMGAEIVKSSAAGELDMSEIAQGIVTCHITAEESARLTPGRAVIGIELRQGENVLMGASSPIDVLKPLSVPGPRNSRELRPVVTLYDNLIAVTMEFGSLPGTPGTAAEIMSVTAETLEPGAAAYARNEGTTSAARLVLGIPAGAKGDPGMTPAQVKAIEQAEAARVKAEAARETAEGERRSAETKRVVDEERRTASETARVKAEQGRTAAESERQAQEEKRAAAERSRDRAEADRASQESARQQAEQQRASAELERSTAEKGRQTSESERRTAETARNTAETARTAAEQARAENEVTRMAAEANRRTAESRRAAAETSRREHEVVRQTNEEARKTAENLRAAAETAREEAEAERAEQFAALEPQIEEAKYKVFIDEWLKIGDLSLENSNLKFTDYDETRAKPFILDGDELNYDEAVGVMLHGRVSVGDRSLNTRDTSSHNLKYILPGVFLSSCSLDLCCYSARKLTSFRVLSDPMRRSGNVNTLVICTSTNQAFANAPNLKRVKSYLKMPASDTQNVHFYSGLSAPLLEELWLNSIHLNINLKQCQNLRLDCWRYMIDNSTNTTSITLTVHPDVYAKLTGDTTNAAAAALTPEELAQWQQVQVDAAEKNITFATV